MLLSRKHGAKFSGEVPWWKYPIIKSKVAHWASPSILCPESALMPQQHQTFSWLCFSWLLTLDLVSLVLETHCLTLSPHFLPQKRPFFPLCFSSLFHWSNVFWQLPVLFQDWPPLSVHVCLYWLFCVFFPQVATHYFPWPSGKPGRLRESNFWSLERDGTCSMHQTGKWWAIPVADSCQCMAKPMQCCKVK